MEKGLFTNVVEEVCMDRREFVKSSVAVAALALTSKLPGSGLQAAETAAGSEYPDLELMDIYGKKIRLSSLAGKVILLDFWSAELGSSNTLNADLKEIYRKYADAPVGFEVYQVAIDTSKAIWITAVQECRSSSCPGCR